MKNKYYPYKVKTGELPLTSGEKDVVIKWIYDTHLVEWYTTYLMKKLMEEVLSPKIVLWILLAPSLGLESIVVSSD